MLALLLFDPFSGAIIQDLLGCRYCVCAMNLGMNILLCKVKTNEMRQLEVSSLAICRGMKK